MKRTPPDKRLDWRDPDMPCIRFGIYPNGKLIELRVKPERVQEHHADSFDNSYLNPDEPHFEIDPSYWWNKKYRKKV